MDAGGGASFPAILLWRTQPSGLSMVHVIHVIHLINFNVVRVDYRAFRSVPKSECQLGFQNILLAVPVHVRIVDDAPSVVQFYEVCTAVTERCILCSRRGHSGFLTGRFYS